MVKRETDRVRLRDARTTLSTVTVFNGRGSLRIPEADDARRRAVEAQIEAESHSFFVTARLYDDGLLDPRDTRTALGIALSAAHSGPVEGRRGFGVFRM